MNTLSNQAHYLEQYAAASPHLDRLKSLLGLPMSLPIYEATFDEASNTLTGKCQQYGIAGLDIVVRISPTEAIAMEVQLSNASPAFLIKGLEWMDFGQLDLSLAIPQDLTLPLVGQASLVSSVASLSGMLEAPGNGSPYQWRMSSPELNELPIAGLLPDFGGSPIAGFFEQAGGVLSTVVQKIEVVFSADHHQLILHTPFSWNMVHGLTLSDMRLAIQSRYDSDLSGAKHLSLFGKLSTGSGETLDMEIDINQRQNQTEYHLTVYSETSNGLSIAAVMGQDTLENQTWLPANWKTNLTATSLQDLSLRYIPAYGNVEAYARGTFLGIAAQLRFSLQKFLGSHYLAFSAEIQQAPVSIQALLTETLHLPIEPQVLNSLPAVSFAVERLGFDQLAQSFQLAGEMELGKTDPVSTYGTLQVQWANGLDIGMKIGSYGTSVSLSQLATAFELNASGAGGFLPQSAWEQWMATSFSSLALRIQTSDRSFHFEGKGILLGQWEVYAAVRSYQGEGQRFLFIDASVDSLDLVLRDMPQALGIAQGQETWLSWIPALTVSPKRIYLNQEEREISLTTDLHIADNLVSAGLAAVWQADGSKQLSMYFSPQNGPMGAQTLLQAVLPAIEGWDNLSPVDFFLHDVRLGFPTSEAGSSLSGTASGVAHFLGSRLAVSAVSDEGDAGHWRFEASGESGQPLPIGAVLTELSSRFAVTLNLPTALEPLVVDALQATFYTQNQTFLFAGLLQNTQHPGEAAYWMVPMGSGTLKIGNLHFSCSKGIIDPAGNPAEAVPNQEGSSLRVAIQGEAKIGNLNIAIQAQLAAHLEFTFTLSEVSLRELAREFMGGVDLPDELPDIVFSQVEVSLNGSTGDYTLAGTVNGHFPLSANSSGFVAQTASLRIERAANGLTAQVGIASELIAELAPGFILNRFAFDFQLEAAQGWALMGQIEATLFDQPFRFDARYAQSENGQTLQLEAEVDGSQELISIPGGGGFSLSSLGLFWQKAGNDSGFQLQGAGRMYLAGLMDFSGTLTLSNDSAKGKDLTFLPETAQLDISLPIEGLPPSARPNIHLEIGAFALLKAAEGWGFEASASMQLQEIPAVVQSFFPPEVLSGSLKKGKNGLRMAFDVPSTLQPDFPELNIKLGGADFSLGKPGLIVQTLALELVKEQPPLLVQELEVRLPETINGLFGWDATANKPRHQVLKPMFHGRLTLSKHIGFSLLESPIHAISFFTKQGDAGQWATWDMSPFAKFDLRVPEFSYSGQRWAASAGCERVGDIKIPLTPLKALFKDSPLAAVLPNALPLVEIDFAGADIYQQLTKLMGKAPGGAAKEGLEKVLELIQDAITILPPQLQEYLTIEIPESIVCEIEMDSIGGGMKIGLKTLDPAQPIRLVLPMMTLLPELMGLTIRALSIGQKASGAMMLIGIDGYVDRFDILQLTAALTQSVLSGSATDISNRFYFTNTVLALPAGVPVPVPLFTDHIGIDYRGALGLDFQANWAFPDPQWGLGEYIQIIGSFLHFLTNKEALLHQDQALIAALNLQLTIGKNYLKLPPYLGGATLGIQQALPAIPIDQGIARFFDFCKTGNLNYLITAIPVEYRIGAVDVSLGPIEMDAAWCISSEAEFRELALGQGLLPPALQEGVLQALPTDPSGAALDNGYIVLMAGGVELGPVAELRGEVGMALTASGGFETGFRLYGEIAQALGLEIGGRLLISPELTQIGGSIALVFFEEQRLSCETMISITPQSFEAEILFVLTDQCTIEGSFLIGKNGLALGGSLIWLNGAGEPSAYAIQAVFSKAGMQLDFQWKVSDFEGVVSILMPGKAPGALFRATVALSIPSSVQEYFKEELKKTAKKEAEDTVNKIYDEWEALQASVDTLDLSLKGLSGWVPKMCSEIIDDINDTIKSKVNSYFPIRGWPLKTISTSARARAMKEANKNAAPYIKRLNRLSKAAKNTNSPTQRTELKAAIQDILDNNYLNVKVLGLTVFKKTLITGSNATKLREAITWIDKLPEDQAYLIDAEKVYEALPARSKILGEIHREIGAGIAGAIPEIRAIRFETDLGFPNLTDMSVEVEMIFKGQPSILSLEVDLTNPTKTMSQILAKFGT